MATTILDIPVEVIQKICHFLSPKCSLQFSSTCHELRTDLGLAVISRLPQFDLVANTTAATANRRGGGLHLPHHLQQQQQQQQQLDGQIIRDVAPPNFGGVHHPFLAAAMVNPPHAAGAVPPPVHHLLPDAAVPTDANTTASDNHSAAIMATKLPLMFKNKTHSISFHCNCWNRRRLSWIQLTRTRRQGVELVITEGYQPDLHLQDHSIVAKSSIVPHNPTQEYWTKLSLKFKPKEGKDYYLWYNKINSPAANHHHNDDDDGLDDVNNFDDVDDILRHRFLNELQMIMIQQQEQQQQDRLFVPFGTATTTGEMIQNQQHDSMILDRGMVLLRDIRISLLLFDGLSLSKLCNTITTQNRIPLKCQFSLDMLDALANVAFEHIQIGNNNVTSSTRCRTTYRRRIPPPPPPPADGDVMMDDTANDSDGHHYYCESYDSNADTADTADTTTTTISQDVTMKLRDYCGMDYIDEASLMALKDFTSEMRSVHLSSSNASTNNLERNVSNVSATS